MEQGFLFLYGTRFYGEEEVRVWFHRSRRPVALCLIVWNVNFPFGAYGHAGERMPKSRHRLARPHDDRLSPTVGTVENCAVHKFPLIIEFHHGVILGLGAFPSCHLMV